jgi:hypothetical protein
MQALKGVSGQRYASAALYLRERPPVPIGWEAGWASELVWTQTLEEKSFASAGDRIPVIEPVEKHYTKLSRKLFLIKNHNIARKCR